jgi:hypothetical protein
MRRAASAVCVLFLSACGGGGLAVYSGPDPGSTAAMIEGYVRQYVLYSETAEITGVDRSGKEGIERSVTGLTHAQLPPGERCVQLNIKKCTAGSCGEPTVCAFKDYFVAGQSVSVKSGSLKFDKPSASGDAIVDGSMQVEVAAKGFATVARRIAVKCGDAVRGVCERGTPELPRQALPVQRK